MENFAKLGMIVESSSLVTATDRQDKMAKASDRLTTATDRNKSATEKKKTATERANRATEAAAAKARLDTGATNQATAATTRLSAAKTKLATASSGAMAKLGGLAGVLGRVAVGFAAVAASVIGFNATIDTLVRFEDSMSKVKAITRASGEELEALRDTAKELGATTEFSASQVGEGLAFLGMAGFDAKESIAAIPAVLDLATASSIDLGRAADIASNIMSGFGIEAKNASDAIDVMAAVASSANTDIPQLGSAIALVGPVANAAGINLREVAAAVGVLGDAGIQGTRAGTSLRQAIAYLVDPADDARGALAELSLSAADVNPEMHSLADIFTLLNERGIETAQAMRIFGIEGSAGALRLASASGDLRKLTGELGNVTGRAKEMADGFRDNIGGSFRNLRSAAEGLAIALGEAGLTTAIRAVVDSLTGLIRGITSAIDAVSEFIGSTELLKQGLEAVGLLLGIGLLRKFNVFKTALGAAKLGVVGLAVAARGLGSALGAVASILGTFAAGGITRVVSALVLARTATAALSVAVGVLGKAVRLAGGPWALLATAVITAADYFDVFGGSAKEATKEADRSAVALDSLNTALESFNSEKSEVTATNALAIAQAFNEESKAALAAASAHYELTRAKMTSLRANLAENPLTSNVEQTGYGSDVMAQVEAAAARVKKAQEDAEAAATALGRTLDIVQGKTNVAPAREMEAAIINLSEAMEVLNDRTSALTSIADISTEPLDDLEERFGSLAATLSEPLKIQLRIAEAGALESAKSVATALVQQFNLALSEINLDEPMRKTLGAVEMTTDEVNELRVALNGISTSGSPEELAASISKVAVMFDQAYGSAEKIPVPMRTLLNQAIEAAQQMGIISNNARSATGNIGAAANAATALLRNLEAAASAIAAIANTNVSLNFDIAGLTAQNKALAEGKDKYDAMSASAVAAQRAQLSAALGSGEGAIREAAKNQLAEFEKGQMALAEQQRINAKLTATTSSSGGGGGGKTAAEKAAKDIASLRSEYDALVGSMDPVYQRTLELAAAEKTINDAFAAGVINVDEKKKATDLLAESYKNLSTVGEQVRDMMASTFASILTGANSAKEAIRQLALQLANMAFTKGFEQLFDSSGATGFLGGFFEKLGWNAKGTDNWRGGPTVVGEEGPEIVNLPRGSQIISNPDSKKMVESANKMARNTATASSFDLGGIRQMGSTATADRFVPAGSSPQIRFGAPTAAAATADPLNVEGIRRAVIEVLDDRKPTQGAQLVSRETQAPTINVSPSIRINQEAPVLPASEASAKGISLDRSTPAVERSQAMTLSGSIGAPRQATGLRMQDSGARPAQPDFGSFAPIPAHAPPMARQQQAPQVVVNVPEPKVDMKVEPKLYFDREKIIGDFMKSPKGRRITMTSVERDGAGR